MTGNIRLEERRIDSERLSGTNRFGTAAAVSSRYTGDSADRYIVIVNGLNSPYARAAGPLASRTSAPILMVTQNSIPPETRAELERLDPLTITIVGGTGVVSSAVQSQPEQFVADPADVIRLARENLYATSRALVRSMQRMRRSPNSLSPPGSPFPTLSSRCPLRVVQVEQCSWLTVRRRVSSRRVQPSSTTLEFRSRSTVGPGWSPTVFVVHRIAGAERKSSRRQRPLEYCDRLGNHVLSHRRFSIRRERFRFRRRSGGREADVVCKLTLAEHWSGRWRFLRFVATVYKGSNPFITCDRGASSQFARLISVVPHK